MQYYVLLVFTLLLQADALDWKGRGCYKDDPSDRDLTGPMKKGSDYASRSKCSKYCYSKAPRAPYRYFGLEFGKECFCGNTYGKYGGASGCILLCTGASFWSPETCGGIDKIEVFAFYPDPLATAVPTQAPPTPAPPTKPPKTEPPATDAPPTNPPKTEPPATDAPDTEAPETMPPDTATPTAIPSAVPTVVPVLDSEAPVFLSVAPSGMDTLVPSTALPQVVLPTASPSLDTESPVLESSSPGVVVVVSPFPAVLGTEVPGHEANLSAVGGAAGVVAVLPEVDAVLSADGLRLLLLSTSCSAEIPRLLHPTGLTIAGRPELGAIIANLAIILTISTVSRLTLCLSRRVSLSGPYQESSLMHELDMLGILRPPSTPFYLLRYFYEGLALAGVRLVVQSDALWELFLGAAVCVVMVGIPLMVFHVVGCDVPVHALYAQAETRGRTERFFLGAGEWVNRSRNRGWVQTHSALVHPYRQQCAPFVGVDLIASLSIATIFGLSPDEATACAHTRLAAAAVYFGMLLLIVCLKPYAKGRDNIFAVVFLGVQGVAACVVAGSFYGGGEGGDESAGYLIAAATVLYAAKVVLDIATELYIIRTGRRTTLQRDVHFRGNAAWLAGLNVCAHGGMVLAESVEDGEGGEGDSDAVVLGTVDDGGSAVSSCGGGGGGGGNLTSLLGAPSIDKRALLL